MVARLCAAMAVSLSAAGCWDSKPAHYYVFCEGNDGNGWDLVDTESENGYLMACSYRSPDKKQMYTARCDADGCD